MNFLQLKETLAEDLKYEGEDFEVLGLAYDSRKVKPGYVFFAIKGLKDDGGKYIKDALENGAGAVITYQDIQVPDSDKRIVRAENVRRTMALFSKSYFGDPTSTLGLIGITGTNGKTTTSYLTRHIFENAGISCGLIGTINYEYGNVVGGSSLTTPDSVELNMILREMNGAGMKFCVMEVSSIALVMDRVYGLNFGTALFTNLTSEHLDFHKDMENYFAAKKILFDMLSPDAMAVSNSDDHYGAAMLSETKAKKFFYSVESKSDLMPANVSISVKGINFEITCAGETVAIESSLTGRFNLYNILASASIALCNGIELRAISDAVKNFEPVKGRFNKINLPNGAVAVIDYSHTSDSLKNAIEAARELVELDKKNGKVITVFGCGGNKDKTKRPVMGNIASSLSDHVIITSDNPRYEDPYGIIDEILSGIDDKKNIEVLEDREEAIRRGLEISREGDIVMICGKGHEDYQEVMGVRSHFDDAEIVAKHMNSSGR